MLRLRQATQGRGGLPILLLALGVVDTRPLRPGVDCAARFALSFQVLRARLWIETGIGPVLREKLSAAQRTALAMQPELGRYTLCYFIIIVNYSDYKYLPSARNTAIILPNIFEYAASTQYHTSLRIAATHAQCCGAECVREN